MQAPVSDPQPWYRKTGTDDKLNEKNIPATSQHCRVNSKWESVNPPDLGDRGAQPQPGDGTRPPRGWEEAHLYGRTELSPRSAQEGPGSLRQALNSRNTWMKQDQARLRETSFGKTKRTTPGQEERARDHRAREGRRLWPGQQSSPRTRAHGTASGRVCRSSEAWDLPLWRRFWLLRRATHPCPEQQPARGSRGKVSSSPWGLAPVTSPPGGLHSSWSRCSETTGRHVFPVKKWLFPA